MTKIFKLRFVDEMITVISNTGRSKELEQQILVEAVLKALNSRNAYLNFRNLVEVTIRTNHLNMTIASEDIEEINIEKILSDRDDMALNCDFSIKDDKVHEFCGCCVEEVELPTKLGVYVCPKCHNFIVNCSMCDNNCEDCSKCQHDKLRSACENLWDYTTLLGQYLKDKEDTPKLLLAYQKNNNLTLDELLDMCKKTDKVLEIAKEIYSNKYDEYRK